MIDELKDIDLYKNIFQSSIEGILVVNDAGFIVKTNPASEQLFGYSQGELIQKKAETLIPMKFRENYEFHRTKYAKKAKRMGQHLDVFGVKKDGSQFPIEINLIPTKIDEKQVIIAFVIDISERMSAKKELAVSEYRMAEAQSLAHVGNWYWNLQTNERSWSDEFYRIYGLPSKDERLNAETAIEFIHPHDRESVAEAVNEAIKSKIPYKYKKRILRPDGSIRHIIAKGKTVFDIQGNPIEMYGTIQDITKHKNIEHELKSSKEKNQAILDTMPDMMFVLNDKGEYVDLYAPQDEKLLMPKEELLGKNIKDILPPEVYKKLKDSLVKAKQEKKLQVIEYAIEQENDLNFYEARIAYFDDHKFLAIIRDITEQKETEQELKAKETQNKAILKALPDVMIVYDKHGNHLEVHASDSSQLVAPHKEHIGQNIDMMLPKDVSEKIKMAFANCEKTRETQTVEYSLTIMDELRDLETRIVQKDNGNFLAIIRDITKKNRIEEKLANYAQELEEKVEERTKELTTTVQKLVESNLSLEDQILITEEAENLALTSRQLISNIAQNFPRGLIAVVNENFSVDYIEGEALDEMGLKGLVNPGTAIDDIEVFSENLKSRLKEDIRRTLKGEHLSFETKFNGKDYLLNTTPLYNNKKATQALLVYNGISQQKQVEANILNTLKKEQELSELKSRFISMASHEFRTPLSAILSSAILIEKLNSPGKEDRRLGYVSKIRSNIKNLVVILNDFLSLSKLQEGKVVAEPTAFDFVDFSKSITEEMEGIKQNGQTIILKHQHPTMEVFLDSKLLRHIVFNLLSNAIKYSEENKEITFKINSNNKQLFLEVTDQGIGIPKEDQNNMFQRFFRAKNVTNIEGTGLGLNIVKQYIELMGGTINLKSELNKGTTFFVEIPLKNKNYEKNIIN